MNSEGFQWVLIRFSDIKKAASKPKGKGGFNTLSNKKCYVGRTIMIQSALHFPDLEKCFTYPQRMRTTHEKFSVGF